MDVLNPQLFRLLQSQFGKVVVANRGEKAKTYYRRMGGEDRLVSFGGEYYRVNCPNCVGNGRSADRKQHLWISYQCGQRDRAGALITHLAVCYRCKSVGQLTVAGILENYRGSFGTAIISEDVEAAAPPEEKAFSQLTVLQDFSDLVPSHPAIQYIHRRRYTPEYLQSRGLCYCASSDDRLLAKRLIIPFYENNNVPAEAVPRLIGYQARAIPGWSTAEEPKYWTCPGFRKSFYLYGMERARQHKLVVVVEGVFGALRLEDHGVAILGSSLSFEQLAQLTRLPPDIHIAVFLDRDTHDFSRKRDFSSMMSAVHNLQSARKTSISMIDFTKIDRAEPDDLTSDEVKDLLHAIERGDHKKTFLGQ